MRTALFASPEPENDEPAPASAERLSTPSGASALVRDDRIEVRDPKGRLLFEYDAGTGRGSLTMPTGDLALHAPEGNIELVAGAKVLCRGALGVAIAAGHGQKGEPALTMSKEGMSLGAPEVSISAERAKVLLADAEYHGLRFSATVGQARMVVDRLEQVASSVFQRAKRVLRHVEGLEQLTAGRVRTLVRGAYSVKGERTSIQAEDEVKIDGKRVHLG
jgi:hypothetical protein